ncbi:unnamed protein product [Fraxinus pennsylvanica]|uniref:Uncharacterized protein n=1 Tax=Fraxinus pennsylvanica TaxID=56036 RepID=A0AAD2DM08_9LAMI|nr:unnamed protein product [Fraxinus pennsylvanica]
MEASKLNSNVNNLREELMAFSFVEAVAVQTLLAAQKSLACLLIESLLNNVDGVPNLIEKRFPLNDLRRMEKPGPENKDGSDTEDDDEEDDGEDADEQVDDDDGDEDFSGGEEGGDDEEEGDPEGNPEANGNDGSDNEDDDGDEDEDEDEDGEDEEEEEEEEDQPPAKKKK